MKYYPGRFDYLHPAMMIDVVLAENLPRENARRRLEARIPFHMYGAHSNTNTRIILAAINFLNHLAKETEEVQAGLAKLPFKTSGMTRIALEQHIVALEREMNDVEARLLAWRGTWST